MLVSSANIFAQDISRQLERSFIYIRKNRGPSILPWGTPQVNLLTLDKRYVEGSSAIFAQCECFVN